MSEQRNIVDRLTTTLDQLRQCTAWKGFAAPQTDVRVKSPAFLIEDLQGALAEITGLRAQLAEQAEALEEEQANAARGWRAWETLKERFASASKALEPFANIGLDVLQNRPGWANEEFWSNWASHYRINYVDFERAAAVAIKLKMDADAAQAALTDEQQSSDGSLASGMQMEATGGAITRRPAHPKDTISGGPPGPSDALGRWEVGKNGWDASDEATREDI